MPRNLGEQDSKSIYEQAAAIERSRSDNNHARSTVRNHERKRRRVRISVKSGWSDSISRQSAARRWAGIPFEATAHCAR